MKINFTDVKPSKGFAPIAGWREVTVDSGEKRISKSEKNPGSTYIKWTLKVNEDQEDAGRLIWYNTSFVDAAKPMLMAFLIAVGFDVEGEFEFKINEDDEEAGEAIVGRQLKVRCKVDGEQTGIADVKPMSESSTGGATSLLV